MNSNPIRNLVRTVVGTALMGAVLGLGALGAAGTANAAPPPAPKTGYTVYTCYDYATQIFYDCV